MKKKMSKSTKSKKNTSTKKIVQTEIHFLASLKDLLASCKDEYISFGNIMKALKDEGLIFLIAVISFPTAIPIPTPPGFTTLFGVPLCILSAQMLYKLGAPWMPKFIADKKLKVTNFKTMINKAEPLFNKLTVLLKPRYDKFTTKHMERIIGLLALLCAVSVALPILFGNAIPSAGIFIMSIGFLYKDGLAVLIGMIVSVIGIIISGAVVLIATFLGIEVLKKLAFKFFL